jgi:maleylacetate reductase
MIVAWGLERLPDVLAELGVQRPALVASRRWRVLDLGIAPVASWDEVPSDRIREAVAHFRNAGADVLVAVGGGSAIDLAKAVSAATGLELVSVPTTYAGSEWTSYFGVRDRSRRMRGGDGGAHPVAAVYEPGLTLGLPPETTVGTAMNVLAHCAEALYVAGRTPSADEHALAGAAAISSALPRVVAAPDDLGARTELLRGACNAGAALAGSGLALAHALAQAIGGRYGLPHGTLNGICLPPVLRFNEPVAADAITRLAGAVGEVDAAAAVERLAWLAGPTRLGQLEVPRDDVAELAATAAERPGAKANPRRASPAELEDLLRSVW